MRDNSDSLKQQLAVLEEEVAALKNRDAPITHRGVRKRSSQIIWGLPLYDIAMGPDLEKGEMRGHARGIIAIGDIATGVLAFGGFARGIIAIGGLAIGVLFGLGGLCTGILAIGGLAIGGLAMGGAAVGFIAVGGAAFGHYAMGGSAMGEYVISELERNPEAVRFFSDWLPFLRK